MVHVEYSVYSLFAAFENLTKAYEKAKRVIDKEGIPPFFIRHLAELEDFTSEVGTYLFLK